MDGRVAIAVEFHKLSQRWGIDAGRAKGSQRGGHSRGGISLPNGSVKAGGRKVEGIENVVDATHHAVEVVVVFPWLRIRPLRGSCLLYTSPSPRDRTRSRMPSSA